MTDYPEDVMKPARVWLIRKGGLYYRPNRAGYTGNKAHAGRYTKAEADREAAIEPWRMSAIHQDDVPDGDIEDDPDALTVAYMAGEAKSKERLAAAEVDAERLASVLAELLTLTDDPDNDADPEESAFAEARAALAAHENRKGERHE